MASKPYYSCAKRSKDKNKDASYRMDPLSSPIQQVEPTNSPEFHPPLWVGYKNTATNLSSAKRWAQITIKQTCRDIDEGHTLPYVDHVRYGFSILLLECSGAQ